MTGHAAQARWQCLTNKKITLCELEGNATVPRQQWLYQPKCNDIMTDTMKCFGYHKTML